MTPPWCSNGSMNRSGGEALGGPQAGAPGTGIGGDLCGARRERWAGHEAKSRVPAADADGHLGWADTAAALGGKEPFDDPILERVVAQDNESSARPKEVHRGSERLLEGVELGVDGDAQGLEDAGRGMDAAAHPRIAGRDALDERRQLLG